MVDGMNGAPKTRVELVRCAPVVPREAEEEEMAHAIGQRRRSSALQDEFLIKLTPKGQKFVEQLEGKSEKQQIEMVKERYGLKDSLRDNEQWRKSQGIVHRKKEMILALLRAEGDGCLRLDKVCEHIELGIEDTFTVIHELNGSLPIGGEPRGDKPFIHVFFDDFKKTVWLEYWPPDGGERAR
jgi:hypothetical protein